MSEYEYKKTTKYDINFPEYCYFFLKRLLTLSNNALAKVDDKLNIEISTSNHPYCYDAFELVVKTMERKGFSTRIPSFKREKIEGKDDVLHYGFTVRKLPKDYDDLPF
jgi:hypothetical protein